MSDWTKVPDHQFSTNEDGHHGCDNCGHVWFTTKVVFGSVEPVATSLDAVCSSCGFPLVEVSDE